MYFDLIYKIFLMLNSEIPLSKKCKDNLNNNNENID